MAGTAENRPVYVAVFRRGTRRTPIARVTGLRYELIDDAIQILFRVKMIVAVKDGAHLVLHQQLVNRSGPAVAIGFESNTAIGVLAAPFVERRRFRATTIL